jgi:basic membrane lipoprotein Med (substrate-binding protein (PBP1-ABC) superfamily)
MSSSKRWRAIVFVVLLAMLFAACARPPAAETPAGEVAPTEAETPAGEATPTEAEIPSVEPPTELRVAAILSQSIDSSWDYTFVESFRRVQQLAPHGLTIDDIVWTEGVWDAEAEVVLREYAESGLYDIIWCHTTCSDQVGNVMNDYPEILWVYVGSGNVGLGGNAYWDYKRIHEPGYLMGMLAGYMTQTDRIGVVGTYSFDDVNDVINAYIQGAKEVNPAVGASVTFIESWYDPARALEASNAQIAAGVDHLLQLAEGFDACTGNVFCYGPYGDYNFIAPNNVLTSAVSYWDPDILWIIDEWWDHRTTGEPYDGNTEPVWFTMAEGGADLAPFHGLESRIPPEAYDAVMQARQDILDGRLQVELNVETPVSD